MQTVEIRVKGHIDAHWSDWFEGLTIRHTEQDESILLGSVVDQAALYGLLTKLRNLGLSLISVNSVEGEEGREMTGSKNEIHDANPVG